MSLTTTNMVCQADLKVSLNLHKIINKIRDAKYNPSRFSAISWNHKSIGASCLLFRNGKLILHGGKSIENARKCVRQYARIIQKLGYSVQTPNLKVITITMLADLGVKINLTNIVDCFDNASYEPELFNAALVKKNGVHFSVFQSGRVVICGVKSSHLIKSIVKPTLTDMKLLCLD